MTKLTGCGCSNSSPLLVRKINQWVTSQGVFKKENNSDEIEDFTISNKSLVTNLTMSQLGAGEPLVISSLVCRE